MKSASLTTSRPDRFIRLRGAQLAAVVVVALPAGTGVFAPAHADVQIADVRDTLDTAVRGPSLYNGVDDPAFDVYVADHEQFDNNVFRLPNNTDVKTTIGPAASRADHINSPSAGLDSQWGLGSVLFGQVGVDYTRALLSYVNALVYTRNTFQQSQFFAAGRYQVGPRWALYGGILDTNIGSSTNVQNQLARHGTSNSQSLNLTYSPIRALTFDASFVHEQRGTNELIRAYNDGLATVAARFMFQ